MNYFNLSSFIVIAFSIIAIYIATRLKSKKKGVLLILFVIFVDIILIYNHINR